MLITTFLKKGKEFLFPPLCVHCEAFLEEEPFFCSDCKLFFELLSPQERCYYCFEESERKVCRACRKKKKSVIRATCLEPTGQAVTLMQKQRQGNLAFIQLTAALLYVQFHRLGFPTPDFLVPLYEVPFSRFLRKCDHNYLLIKELQKKFQVPLLGNSIGRNLLMVKDRAQPEEIEATCQKLQKNAEGKPKIFVLTLLP